MNKSRNRRRSTKNRGPELNATASRPERDGSKFMEQVDKHKKKLALALGALTLAGVGARGINESYRGDMIEDRAAVVLMVDGAEQEVVTAIQTPEGIGSIVMQELVAEGAVVSLSELPENAEHMDAPPMRFVVGGGEYRGPTLGNVDLNEMDFSSNGNAPNVDSSWESIAPLHLEDYEKKDYRPFTFNTIGFGTNPETGEPVIVIAGGLDGQGVSIDLSDALRNEASFSFGVQTEKPETVELASLWEQKGLGSRLINLRAIPDDSGTRYPESAHSGSRKGDYANRTDGWYDLTARGSLNSLDRLSEMISTKTVAIEGYTEVPTGEVYESEGVKFNNVQTVTRYAELRTLMPGDLAIDIASLNQR